MDPTNLSKPAVTAATSLARKAVAASQDRTSFLRQDQHGTFQSLDSISSALISFMEPLAIRPPALVCRKPRSEELEHFIESLFEIGQRLARTGFVERLIARKRSKKFDALIPLVQSLVDSLRAASTRWFEAEWLYRDYLWHKENVRPFLTLEQSMADNEGVRLGRVYDESCVAFGKELSEALRLSRQLNGLINSIYSGR